MSAGDWNVGGPASGGSGLLRSVREAWEALETAAGLSVDWMREGDVAAPTARMMEALLIAVAGRPDPLSLGVLGNLGALSLPATNLGSELSAGAGDYTLFQGARETPGSSGTTTVQLEVDGVPVAGAELSWTPADAAYAVKSVAINEAVTVGSRVSIRVTSVESGAQTIHCKVS